VATLLGILCSHLGEVINIRLFAESWIITGPSLLEILRSEIHLKIIIFKSVQENPTRQLECNFSDSFLNTEVIRTTGKGRYLPELWKKSNVLRLKKCTWTWTWTRTQAMYILYVWSDYRTFGRSIKIKMLTLQEIHSIGSQTDSINGKKWYN
jgi:hypothetical protein